MIEIIAIYEFPSDYPDHYVARWFKLDQPTSRYILADTLEELLHCLKDDIQNKYFISRQDRDPPCILGCYI